MSAQLKIEKNIPLPARRRGSLTANKSAEVDALAAKMTAGDSVLMTYPVSKNATSRDLWRASHAVTHPLRKAIERRGLKAASRSVRPGKIRIWALKK
jgi:hypothetical protein